jgi:predicted  nucleic acid-binding Zn-ribbon protein
MANELREQISRLVRLQHTEGEIRKLQHLLSQVQSRTAALDAQLQEFVTAVESGKQQVLDLTKSSRDQEADLKVNESRIGKSEEKLRAVKTNKEYQSGLKEIEDLRAAGSKIEEEILAGMDKVEAARQAVQEHQARLDRHSALILEDKETVLREADEARSRLQQLEAEAAELSSGIAPNALSLYRRVKSKKADGVAIVPVEAAVCRGCNVNIPPQMYNELQRVDRLKNCPNCDRILYWAEQEDRPE